MDRMMDRSSSPKELGAICRFAREQAGVSLRQMANRTHRDVSSLSRFERGQVAPRDIDRLLADYQTLARAQREPQTKTNIRRWPFLYLGGTLSATTLLLAITQHPNDANVARAWVMISLTILIALAAQDALIRYRQEALRECFYLLSYASLAAGLVVHNAMHWNEKITPGAQGFAITAIVFGYLALAANRSPAARKDDRARVPGSSS